MRNLTNFTQDGYCSGNARLFELSESCRSGLLHHAKCTGIFSLENHALPPADASDEEKWRCYIRQETTTRLGWAIYKYDASVAYLHNNRPFLTWGDMKLRLPGTDEHWQAESAYAWASLHPWSRTLPATVQLRVKIRSLFDGTPNALEDNQEEDHLSIIVITLLRMLWTLKENRSDPINDLITAQSTHHQERQVLLQAIDRMAPRIPSVSAGQSRAETERLVHRAQLVHVAHLYGAGDLMNWLFPFLRDDAETEHITMRMRHWALEDGKRVREVAFHCAQIIGLIRSHPTQMALQSFVLFHAGVVLACMSTLLPRSYASREGRPVQLDQLGMMSTTGRDRHLDWINNECGDKPCLVGVPVLCSPIGWQQVLDQTASLLKRQKSWGIASSLTRVLTSLRARKVAEWIEADGTA